MNIWLSSAGKLCFMESCRVFCGVSFGYAVLAAWRQSLGYSFRCNTDREDLIFKVTYTICTDTKGNHRNSCVATITLDDRTMRMEKALQPNALGTGGSGEQLGLCVSVLCVWHWLCTSPLWLAHMLPVLLPVNLAASQACQLQGRNPACADSQFAQQLLPCSD